MRSEKGWRQSDVAKKICLSSGTYAAYEQGRAEPNLSTLCNLADVFGVTIDWLLGRR